MEEASSNQFLFKIESPYTLEVKETQKSFFLKEKSKNLSIIQKGKLIIKLHQSLLEEEFEQFSDLFHKNELEVPEEFNPFFIEIITKYFYFKEIEGIALNDIFGFLRLAFYMKINVLVMKVIEYLYFHLNDVKKVCFIRKNAYDFIFFYKEEGKKLMDRILNDCTIYFIKGNYYEEFLSLFKQEFLDKMVNYSNEIFASTLEILKKFECSNEQTSRFISLFKGVLLDNYKKKEEKNSKEEYIRTILEENLDFSEIGLKDVEVYRKKQKVIETEEIKKFIIDNIQEKFSENKKKFDQLDEENKSLKNDLEQNKFEFKNLKENSEREILSLKYDLNRLYSCFLMPDKTSQFIFIHFPQFTNKELLFDSSKDDKKKLKSRIEGKTNVVFLIHPQEDNLIFGAYYSIPFPTVASKKPICYKDENSCIFEIHSNKIFKANVNQSFHLKTYPNYLNLFMGNAKEWEGMFTKYCKILYGLEGDNLFGSHQFSAMKLLKIYQLQ